MLFSLGEQKTKKGSFPILILSMFSFLLFPHRLEAYIILKSWQPDLQDKKAWLISVLNMTFLVFYLDISKGIINRRMFVICSL